MSNFARRKHTLTEMATDDATLQFIRQHAADDVRQLALRRSVPEGVDLAAALQQIEGRQTARRKLPKWAALDGLVYPPHLNMEQCSSELTARYKADLCRQLTDGGRLLDLTGGLGVDTAFMAEVFDSAVYVERSEQLCDLARHNLPLVCNVYIEVVCADGTDYLQRAGAATLIYIDPSRRDDHGGRTYALADCQPNVVPMVDELLDRADIVMLKLSPMLDWRKAVADVGRQHAAQVHIVAAGGECKELLLVLQRQAGALTLVCTDTVTGLAYSVAHALDAPLCCPTPAAPAPGMLLYEPHAAVMKAGCFGALARDFGVAPLAPNSHLFLAAQPVGFPGRSFRIEAVTTLNKRALKATLGHLRQANISVRNFPLPAQALRQRLKLADGGPHYIFATTLADNTHVLLLCQKP